MENVSQKFTINACMYYAMLQMHVKILYSGLFLRGNFFANALWCDLLRVKISQIVYKALNEITVQIYL